MFLGIYFLVMCMIFKTLDRCELPLDTRSKGSEGHKLRAEIEFNQLSVFIPHRSYLLVKNHHNFTVVISIFKENHCIIISYGGCKNMIFSQCKTFLDME